MGVARRRRDDVEGGGGCRVRGVDDVDGVGVARRLRNDVEGDDVVFVMLVVLC